MDFLSEKNLAVTLGFAGLIPFVGLAALIALDPLAGDKPYALALQIYAAVILSFLGGVVWGRMLAPGDDFSQSRTLSFAYSVLPSLVGWGAVVFAPSSAFLLLSAGFALAFAYDRHLERGGVMPGWYLNMRIVLTLVVIASLMLAAFAQAG